VSRANACPYCVDVHRTALLGLPRMRHAESTAGARPGPDLTGVAVTFQYLNRMVNLFLEPSPIPTALPPSVRHGIQHVIGRLMAPTNRRHRPPGAALALLPAAPLPDDLAWAAESPMLADAFARAAAAFETAGARSVPPAVRELVLDRLDGWDGTAPGTSRAWADDAVAGLAADERAAGRLAMLAALASYQAGPSVIADLRGEGVDDRGLVELASWASFATARRIGARTPS
jgi:hypothetical protein